MSGKENKSYPGDPPVFKCRICVLLPKIPVVTYCRHEFCASLDIKNSKRVGYRPEAPKRRQMYKHLYIWIFLCIY